MSEHRGKYTYGYTSDRQARRNSADKISKSRGARRDHGSSSRREEAGSSSSQAETGAYNADYTDETQQFHSPPQTSYAPSEYDLPAPTTCGLEKRINGQPVLDTRTNTWEKCGNPLDSGLAWCRTCKPILSCNAKGCTERGQEEYPGAGFSCNWHNGFHRSYEVVQRERAEREAAAAAAAASAPQVIAETEKEREEREARQMAELEIYQQNLDNMWRR
ncbi:hypothetical protein BCIN_14g00800 [Botrytis cinerea B05.10]|uniref:Uncharacterized protein n=2 Tax=Botryotinia fuckeliana TaxID=40559 RepID=A0A384K217_BOTFB|nr:hypothetical protein BCIN_14g00800 [Botrytis cinerea B05.10]ATZ56865.1 hypothetical protein BCIN_14g00800 [Botrytis cinerea B05.10]